MDAAAKAEEGGSERGRAEVARRPARERRRQGREAAAGNGRPRGVCLPASGSPTPRTLSP